MRKRIGIDFHVFDGKYQGSRTHAIELFRRIFGLLPQVDFFLFLENVSQLRALGSEFTLPNVHLIQMRSRSAPVRLIWQLPHLQRSYQIDLLHVQYIGPMSGAVPFMVTIHDILFEAYPEFFPWLFRVRSRLLMRDSARRAVHVFTVSEFSRSEIEATYAVPKHKISVVHNAIDPARFFPGSGGQEDVLKRGLTPGQYLLFVGRLEPRKNIANLLRAYAALNSTEFPLVIVGQRDFGYSEVFDLRDSLNLEKKVRILEDATDNELAALYRHALVFVYPTLAEGFGMPPLEAMACGCPVVTSNVTALPEVVGDAALCIDPHDVPALTQALRIMLEQSDFVEQCRIRGLARAGSFRWERAAVEVATKYTEFLGLPSAGDAT